MNMGVKKAPATSAFRRLDPAAGSGKDSEEEELPEEGEEVRGVEHMHGARRRGADCCDV